MSCVNCAQRIERVLGKLDGVEKATVNYATEKATITYDPALVRLPEMRAAIDKAGYKALNYSLTESLEADRSRRRAELRKMWLKFIVAAVFVVPLLYLAMAPMITGTCNIVIDAPKGNMMKPSPVMPNTMTTADNTPAVAIFFILLLAIIPPLESLNASVL
jgi:cation transport ATPase